MSYQNRNRPYVTLPRGAAKVCACLVPIVLAVFACKIEDRSSPVSNPIPLNLDFSRSSLVAADRPWGWWLRPLESAGVQVEWNATPGSLQLSREQDGERGWAVYDLIEPFAGRAVTVGGSFRRLVGTATADIRLVAYAADGELLGESSRATTDASLEATLQVDSATHSLQLELEYRGHGSLIVAPLRLQVDGTWVEQPHLPLQFAPSETDVAWVRDRAIPLDTVDPARPLDDLTALKPLVGGAAFVLLGESTHGTREFFQLKHRMTRWLAEQEGFTVFALEDHAGTAARIDRYISTGEGTAAAAVRGMFGVWARREMIELIRWMREATASGGARIAFVGFDLQVPLDPISELTAFGEQHDPQLVTELEEALGPMLAAWQDGWYPQRDAEEYARWSAGAERIVRRIEDRVDAYREQVGDDDAEQAMYNARLIWQSAEVSGSPDPNLRDRFMAENLSRIRDRFPAGTRVVAWAHNSHVRLDENKMGQHLERLHPGEVISIALQTHAGEYTAYSGSTMETYALFPAPADSIEEVLHLSGHPILALNLRPTATDPASEQFRALRFHRNIGLWPADFGFYRAPIADGFHALLFVDRTTPTQPIE